MLTALRKRLDRPLDSYNKIWLGTIALAVVGAILATAALLQGLDLGRGAYRAEFAQAAQLRSGDRVTVAGITVGEVDRVSLTGDRVRVDFKVDNGVHLGRDTHAAIKLTTLLGSRYLELSPAGPGRLDHATVKLDNTSVPYNLQQTLADATTTFDQIDADQVAQSLTTLSSNLDGVPEALPQALKNLKSLSTVISTRRDQLHTLLASTDSLSATIRDQKANLGALIVRGRDLLGELASRRAALQRLFSSATALVDTLNRVLGDQPGLNELINSIKDLAHMVSSHDGQFRALLQALPIPMRNIANATGSGTAADATLPAGPLVDSWMCAISGRAKQFNLVEYFKDCQ
ncbi:MlaD family protein [Mycobacterium sp. SM3041]|uniref:MlaD family protein n=1 Tax=Mycobacterium sp. SM3041 TaxID=3114291 RepID=UPI0032048835